jgi:hypothetical protein
MLNVRTVDDLKSRKFKDPKNFFVFHCLVWKILFVFREHMFIAFQVFFFRRRLKFLDIPLWFLIFLFGLVDHKILSREGCETGALSDNGKVGILGDYWNLLGLLVSWDWEVFMMSSFSGTPIITATIKIPDHPKNAPNLSPNPTTRHQQFQSNYMTDNFQSKFLKNPGLHPASLWCKNFH